MMEGTRGRGRLLGGPAATTGGETMKRGRKRILGGATCLAALAAVAVIALPASGTAPPGSALFVKLDGEHGPLPDADVDGYGTFSAGFSGTKLCYGLQVFKIGNPTAAHIHQGGANTDGPIKVGLLPPTSGLAGSRAGCTTLTTTLANQIKANPGAYYVNVHNSAFPNGAIRGQLFQATATQDK
jgi:CHRD domain